MRALSPVGCEHTYLCNESVHRIRKCMSIRNRRGMWCLAGEFGSCIGTFPVVWFLGEKKRQKNKNKNYYYGKKIVTQLWKFENSQKVILNPYGSEARVSRDQLFT